MDYFLHPGQHGLNLARPRFDLDRVRADHLSDGHIRTLLLDDELGPLPTKEEIIRVTGVQGKTLDGKGLVMLLEPEGKSVVSDIDDTIKVSEIPAGKAIILRNTFLRQYVALRECGTATSVWAMSPSITYPEAPGSFLDFCRAQ